MWDLFDVYSLNLHVTPYIVLSFYVVYNVLPWYKNNTYFLDCDLQFILPSIRSKIYEVLWI